MKLNYFQSLDFLAAIKELLNELKVPFNAIADEPVPVREILSDKTYKDNATFRLINEVFFVGMVDDAAFEGNESLAPEKIKSDYDGILFFGVTLNQRDNKHLPTRGQLAEIARAFNREFYYTPVVVIFKYQDEQKEYIAFANTERLPYKQEWREGEKAGKVSLLRDIAIDSPHRGHEEIINQLRISTRGRKAVTDFDRLYKYWQEVFSVSILNKKFYQELSNWYFWAIKNVTFPNCPTLKIAHQKGVKLDDLIQEHNATNVIRLLTRLLFTWFIKEKKLIPEELFDLDALQKNILKEVSPYHQEGMFKEANEESVYYKAILQNLFFASLNCPIEPDDVDERKRGFRELTTKSGKEARGKHQGVDYLMRYKESFKNPQAFLELINSKVPFLNGGLFECLDDKGNKVLQDGFSDNLKGYKERLVVPDYLFFGLDEEVDLSKDYGLKSKKYKKAAVKGLINILKSYKFTVTENTPIEEDVALDPELLGKVFENLLASYNPETKTTARKQTGSFYTPREIVNYMVDESLIAYLKNAVQDWEMEEKALNKALHQLASFDAINPFADDSEIANAIISALDQCKILDPACGSGAFPMGILQKMVHILQKLDPENELWKELQLSKALQATEEAYSIEDKAERKEKLLEINDAFDESVNDPDYARKLYLIENCVYGVDIQPIATQISKLRFFISLVVDQKVNNDKPNFGIRALPNLETKFVTANTLIGIEKPSAQASLFNTDRIKELEGQLKHVRKKLFSARTKKTKTKYRLEDKRLRNAIAEELKISGWQNEAAEKLANWDPYDQNASSSFFDPEWMFDVSEGFDVVIGNPPYVKGDSIKALKPNLKNRYKSFSGNADLYIYFIDFGISSLSSEGVLSYITPNKWIQSNYGSNLRKLVSQKRLLKEFLDFGELPVFKEASTFPSILLLQKGGCNTFSFNQFTDLDLIKGDFDKTYFSYKELEDNHWAFTQDSRIVKLISKNSPKLKDVFGGQLLAGIKTGANSILILNKSQVPEAEKDLYRKIVFGKNLKPYEYNDSDEYLFFPYKFENGKNVLLDLDNYPESKNYFLQYKEKLKNRAIIKDGVKKGKKRWYELQQINMKFNYLNPKIIYPDISSRNKFIYDESGIIPDMTCFFIPTKLIEYVPLFNSSIFWFLAAHYCPVLGNYKEGGRIRFKSTYLENIPLPKLPEKSINILKSISKIMHWNPKFENISDAICFNLYFPVHMKEREIDVLKFVERDLEKVLKGREFDSLSDPEKEEIFEQLHATWTHPDNEVRNRIKLFAVRSPEILKPILEG